MTLRVVGSAAGQTTPEKTTFEVYGRVWADYIADFDQMDPLWFDILRPSKLPAFEDQFEPDGNSFFSVRPSRFGVRTFTPTRAGTFKTLFEFDLFGTGVSAGQTTIRLSHAFGELGQFGAGQTFTPFMDPDVLPATVEFWGPNGSLSFRNPQIRWSPLRGTSHLTLAVERPGASGDGGIYRDRIELEDIRPHFPYPDLTADGRYGRSWGYVELGGIVRRIEWEDVGDDTLNLEGSAWGWGLTFSSKLNLTSRDLLKVQATYGEAIGNVINDSPVDIGIASNPEGDVPVKGSAIPMLAWMAYLEHSWSSQFKTTLGYSQVRLDNTDLQRPDAFHEGEYATLNLMYFPAENVTAGAELQWGARENFSDGFESEDIRFQLGFRYNFSMIWEK